MAAIGAVLMGRVVTHTEAELAFHPWWDDMEDYLVYGLVMVGVILVPSAIVTGTPLDCNYCQKDFCGEFTNSTTTIQYNNNGKEDPKFNGWWVKKYCTFNGAVDGLLLYFPYFVLLVALTLFSIEKIFQRSFKSGEKLNKFYHLLTRQKVLEENFEEITVVDSTFETLELKHSLKKCKSYFYSYLIRTVLELLVALALFIYMLQFGQQILVDSSDILCDVHGYFYECHGIPIYFYLWSLYVSAALTVLYIICSLYNFVWLVLPCFGHSARLMRSYIKTKKELVEGGGRGVREIYNNNRDLRLLLGLLANSSGVPTTISVLAMLDQEFCEDWQDWKIVYSIRSKDDPGKAFVQFKEERKEVRDHIKELEGRHTMYIAEVYSGTKYHARAAIGLKPGEATTSSNLCNGRWQIEELEEDKEYTVRVKTVLDGKTICIISKKIENDVDGIFDELQDTFIAEQKESMNSYGEVAEAEDVV